MHHRVPSASTRGVWACMALVLAIQAATTTVVASPALHRTTEQLQEQLELQQLQQRHHHHNKQQSLTHHITKRSFFDIQCKGVYDKSIFAKLDRICEDCYNLFREPSLHSLCRKNCFTTDYFKGCLESLQLTDEIGEIQTWIKLIHGAEPGLGD